MTDTIQAPADTAADEATEAVQSEEFLHLDPAAIIIGTNVRTDLRPDHKEFRKSIKERGVLEAITVYRDEDGQYVLLRGQRRTVTAAEVGTPTGLIPARVVPQPGEADRIGDQMVENIHRAGMCEAEIVAGVEQLALLGVSAAQIAKRTSIDRPTVNAALAVTNADQSRNRLDSGDLTLEEAAIFAEFEHDPDAVERLENAKRWRRSLAHEAQRLRDEAAEREADAAEVERLRTEGLPVLTAEEVEQADEVLRIERLVTENGEPLAEEEWPNVPGARVHVVKEWVYPEDEYDKESEDGSDEESEDYEPAEPYQQYVPVWVVTDLAASGLRRRGGSGSSTADSSDEGENEEEAEAQREQQRQERRRVIANNKAWASAETVRREWLAGFVARKTAPKGAEALICEAVVTGHHSLSKAMDHRHPMLFTLLGVERPTGYYGAGHYECRKIATNAGTPKAATMTTLAAVVAAWEATTGKHSWRNPSALDARVLGALVEWGYQPSEVERILLGEEQQPTTEDADDNADEASDSAA
ncbi:ParB/RepB/Spo0J family partition protein [Pimelobacter simplex]|uniref:ParB/RepB/Spo0J family partition protein n=1 Tax=Nocardioides simplex TaxID=2045 RepID=UPI00214FD3EC|nr:ParB N-terminal domain-containing protein [Pimelobacter simplex]UUW88623.1 ParB N-terminal domain-containing protein [Pimelobacter simplex]UUW98128.1 ParB N-terminal domain-containing protein [Pimelobacter simplex]